MPLVQAELSSLVEPQLATFLKTKSAAFLETELATLVDIELILYCLHHELKPPFAVVEDVLHGLVEP